MTQQWFTATFLGYIFITVCVHDTISDDGRRREGGSFEAINPAVCG
jgi:hypothetical protein